MTLRCLLITEIYFIAFQLSGCFKSHANKVKLFTFNNAFVFKCQFDTFNKTEEPTINAGNRTWPNDLMIKIVLIC